MFSKLTEAWPHVMQFRNKYIGVFLLLLIFGFFSIHRGHFSFFSLQWDKILGVGRGKEGREGQKKGRKRGKEEQKGRKKGRNSKQEEQKKNTVYKRTPGTVPLTKVTVI